MRAYQQSRISASGQADEVKLRAAARQRALRRLAKDFPDRYREVLAEELEALGVLAILPDLRE